MALSSAAIEIDAGPLAGQVTRINEHGRMVGYVNVGAGSLHAVVSDLNGRTTR